MKDYIYTQSLPYAIKDAGGILKIHKGDTISKEYEEGEIAHCTTSFGRSFRIPINDIDKYFKRQFDYEETKYYNQLRDKAAIAVMQGIIANGMEDHGGPERNMKLLISTSVKVATALVEELKATV
jgi:hypothetical protein